MRLFQNQQRTSHWSYIVVLGALLLTALTLLSYSVNKTLQNERIAERMSEASVDISEQIGGIRSMMASLVGLHQATGNLEQHELMLFSEQIREHADYIDSIGRYEHISDDERPKFEGSKNRFGLLNFTIQDFNAQGKRTTRPSADWYYPITVLEPLTPSNARLLGADLSSIPGLAMQLDSIANTNDILFTNFPSVWPFGDHLVFFKPVYLGQEAPITKQDRRLQAAGGFWISIDVNKFLNNVIGKLKDFDIRVQIVEGKKSTTLFSQSATYQQKLYLRWLYPRQKIVERWKTNSSSLVIQFERDTGYTAITLLTSIFSIIATILLFTSFNLQRVTRKKSEIERQQARDVLFEVREMAERTLNAVQDSIVTLDAQLHILYVNPAAAIQFNIKPRATLGKPFDQIVQFQLAESKSAFNLNSAVQNLAHTSKGEFDVVPLGQSHADYVLKMTLTSSLNLEGEVTGHVVVMRNISYERKLTAKLAFQANNDSLTGCSNRYFFEQTLQSLIDQQNVDQRMHALLYMDLDQFKIINDTCGHGAGDQLLIELTENLKAIIRDQDVLSRLGGDEFGLLLIDVTNAQTKAISERIFNFFQSYIFHYEEKAFAVRACIGVVHIDGSKNSIKDVLSAADIACYAAKDAGRNNLYVYSPDDHEITERSAELSWLPKLQNALQNDKFVLYVQPVAAVLSGNFEEQKQPIEHFEFLLRLRNPDGTVLTPWQFIRAAERYDLMRQIDRWVIHNALRTITELKDGPGGNCSFSINLSGQSAADPSLKDFIQEQFNDFQVDPSKIWFELTETAAISHFSIANELFQSIRAMGSLIALDDFGSGLSSFGYLKNIPIDIIKIDGQFVRNISSNKIDQQIVTSIQQLAQVMKIKTVAEFVENQEIFTELAKVGIDYAQGYHIGKPLPLDEAIIQLRDQLKAA